MVCVGEHLEDRERGKTNEVVSKQLKAVAGECGSGGQLGGKQVADALPLKSESTFLCLSDSNQTGNLISLFLAMRL